MKQKKLVSVLVLFAFAVTMICPVSAFAASFTDVSSDHWAIQQVERMNARGIIVGYPDGTNRPNNPVTQFEAITMAEETLKTGAYVRVVSVNDAGILLVEPISEKDE